MRNEQRGGRLLLYVLALVSIPVIHIGTALMSQHGPVYIERVVRDEYALLNLGRDDAEARRFLDSMIQAGYRVAWQGSGLEEAMAGSPGSLSHMLTGAWPAIKAWILTVELLAMRWGVVMLALPLYVLLLALAFVDGIAGWFIRRTVAGRESAFIYHRAKRLFQHVSWVGLWVYFATPIAIDPIYVFPPWFIASALALHFTASWFKKYL